MTLLTVLDSLLDYLPPYLHWPAQFCLFTSFTTWIASLLTGNVSQVDRLWTFLPTIYTAYFALLPLLPTEQQFWGVPYAPKEMGWKAVKDFSPRALLMLGLVTIWMFRLSYNTYRRGLFSLKDEDYRWSVLRAQLHPLLFQLVNLTFIAFIQNVLLLLLGLPTSVAALQQPHTPLTQSDYILAGIALVILAVEFTADNQQFAFHAYKHSIISTPGQKLRDVKVYSAKEHWPGARLKWTPDDAYRGFVTKGLWRYSRHPNFACEQSFWWVINLIPLLAPSPPSLPRHSEIPTLKSIVVALLTPSLHQSLIASLKATFLPTLYYLLPAICLSTLFFSSTAYTEAISISKYPEAYKAYRKRVGMFSVSETVWKWLKLTLFSGEEERRRVERMVWGAAHRKEE